MMRLKCLEDGPCECNVGGGGDWLLALLSRGRARQLRVCRNGEGNRTSDDGASFPLL